MKRYLQVVVVALVATLALLSGNAAANSLRVANHVYNATFVDANGYSTKYQVVCFTGKGKAAYVNVDGFNEYQGPVFNQNHQQQERQLRSYLTSKKQRQKAAKADSFVIKGQRITINNGLVTKSTSAKIDQGATNQKFIARYPNQGTQK